MPTPVVLSPAEMRALLTATVQRDFPSLAAAARAWKVGEAYLARVLAGQQVPGPALLGLLGLRRVVRLEGALHREITAHTEYHR